MSYSCSDFTDSIIDALRVEIPDESNDSPSDQADICLAKIDRLQSALKRIADYEYRADRRHKGMADVSELQSLKRIAAVALE
jgi:hypothetical protein